jgi:hypothetical protein
MVRMLAERAGEATTDIQSDSTGHDPPIPPGERCVMFLNGTRSASHTVIGLRYRLVRAPFTIIASPPCAAKRAAAINWRWNGAALASDGAGGSSRGTDHNRQPARLCRDFWAALWCWRSVTRHWRCTR